MWAWLVVCTRYVTAFHVAALVYSFIRKLAEVSLHLVRTLRFEGSAFSINEGRFLSFVEVSFSERALVLHYCKNI